MEISKEELQQLMSSVIGVALAESKKMNPLEQKAFDEQIEKDKRRRMMMVQLGKIEEEAARRKKYGCTHSRHPSGHKLAGHPCPRGQGEWVTGGQLHSRGIASVICLRCATTWLFRPRQEDIQGIIDGGLAGVAPPDDDSCLSQRCRSCSEFFTQDEYEAHDKDACKAKIDSLDSLLV